jgi:hypothetical protein
MAIDIPTQLVEMPGTKEEVSRFMGSLSEKDGQPV